MKNPIVTIIYPYLSPNKNRLFNELRFISFITLFLIIILGCSKESDGGNEGNRPPSSFKLLFPEDGTSEVILSPEIVWEEAKDPENGAVTYSVYLDSDSEPKIQIKAGLRQTTFPITTELKAKTRYYWMIKAVDSEKNMTESSVFSFTTIAEDPNGSPKNFSLTLPEDQHTEIPLKPSFTWEASQDPGGDAVSYDLYLDTIAQPTTVIKAGLSDPTFSVTSELELDTEYYWMVKVNDSQGNFTESTIFSFKTISSPPNGFPNDFSLLTPENQSAEVSIAPLFNWETANDPDGDDVTYDLYLEVDDQASMLWASNLEANSYELIGPLGYGTIYYWKIIANDTEGNSKESEIFTFTTESEETIGSECLIDEDDVAIPFTIVEEVPIFPGCEDSNDKRRCFVEKVNQHIIDNFVYPHEAIENGVQGRVSVSFVITKEGKITCIRTREPDPLLANEAVRIISLLPDMKPGRQRERAVDVPYSTQIFFKLN